MVRAERSSHTDSFTLPKVGGVTGTVTYSNGSGGTRWPAEPVISAVPVRNQQDTVGSSR
ncbi:hypothetical protein FAGKG844_730014 [Frankia sp. AgKG'84/4]